MGRKKKTGTWDALKEADTSKENSTIVGGETIVSTIVTEESHSPVLPPIKPIPLLSIDDIFDKALQFTLWAEGGYVNNKNDRGGPTNLGVTQSTYSHYLRMIGQSNKSVTKITQDEARDVYLKLFFNLSGCQHLPLPLACAVFDFAANSGPGRAVIYLQRIVGASADGDFGPKTLEKVTEYIKNNSFDKLVDEYIWDRFNFFVDIGDNPGQSGFLRGWLDRLITLVMYLQSDYTITKEMKQFELPRQGTLASARAKMDELLKR